MLESVKIGYRNLKKRKERTFLTIFAIGLGVSIMLGVNMGNDTIISSIEYTLEDNLGNTDIVLSCWSGAGYQDVVDAISANRLDNLGGWVPRFVNYAWNLAAANGSGIVKAGISAYLAGIDVNLAIEKDFGKAILYSVHSNFTELTSQVGMPVNIEDLLKTTPTIQRPCVVTRLFLENNKLLGNLTVGDKFYIQNNDYLPEFPGSTYSDPSTWPYYTITAIVDDKGEMATMSLYNNFIYMNMEDMWQYTYNGPYDPYGDITYIFVHCTDKNAVSDLLDELTDVLEDATGSYFYGYAPKASFLDNSVMPAMVYVRIFFSVIAGVSLVVCGVLIKNLFETAKQTDIHEIGILKGIGFDQNFITKVYFSQILIMASIGILVGIGIGTVFSYVFVLVLKESGLSSLLMGSNFDVLISISISPLTISIGVLAGYATPLIFGIIPVIQTARTSVINAIQGRTTGRAMVASKLLGLNALLLGAGITLAVLGTLAVRTSIDQIVAAHYLVLANLVVPLALIFLGTIGFLIGLILIGIFCLPALSKAFTWLFLLPAGKSLRTICHRNLMRNKRRTINTFMMMAIGLSFMVTITTLTSSISAGAYPGKKTRIGGDISIGNPVYNYQANNMTIDHEFLEQIDNLPLVTTSCLYRFSIDFSSYSLYSLTPRRVQGTRQISQPTSPVIASQVPLGNKIDEFGYLARDIYSGGTYNGTYEEHVNVGIIDAENYYMINKDSFLKVTGAPGVDTHAIFTQLDAEDTILLQSSMKPFLRKEPGETITLEMEGMSVVLRISGYADILPGFPWTLNLGDVFGGYGYYNPNSHDYCGVISWNTYDRLIDAFYKDTDLIVKNRYWDAGGVPAGYWGALGFPINMTSTKQLLNGFFSNGTIQNASFSISNYYPFPVEYWNSRPFEYHGTNDTQMSEYFFQPTWNLMNSSIYCCDDTPGYEYGGSKIISVNEDVPYGARDSVEDILSWYEHNSNVNACIVNRDYAHKPNYPLGTDETALDSVYSFEVGDVIRMRVNDTLSYEYSVVATVGSSLNYDYETDKNVTSPLVLNPKTLNFNTYQNGTPGSPMSLFNTWYADANVIFISRQEYISFLENLIEMLAGFAGWEIFPGVTLGSLSLFSQVLAYNDHEGDYSNMLYLDVNEGVDIDSTQVLLEQLFASIPETENFTVFNPRKAFFQITGYKTGNAFLGAPSDKLGSVVEEIKALYSISHRMFDDGQVDYFGKGTYDFYIQQILGIVTTVFNMIMAFALAISLIGLSIYMLISVHQRRREIGTLRSVGYSRKQILSLIFGESMTLGLLGLVIGLIAGLFTANMMIAQVPFIVVFPILFTPPVMDYVATCITLFTIFLFAAIVPARTSMKMDIADVLRSPE